MNADSYELKDLKWVPIGGNWKENDAKIIFTGGEYLSDINSETTKKVSKAKPVVKETTEPKKYVEAGHILFNLKFSEGEIRSKICFKDVDARTKADLMIQYDPSTGDMLNYGLGGGGHLYQLSLWANDPNLVSQQSGTSVQKTWQYFIQGGQGKNIEPNRDYEIKVQVRGSQIITFLDEVEVGKFVLGIPALLGLQIGIFCMSHSEITFSDFVVRPTHPKAFIVMQFDTPEYDALYRDVIEPICKEFKLAPHRGDSTYLPGLVIEDIKKQIAESRIVIAEITPTNPNVYYEVGYADALKKPLILIADKREGLKPFDVQAYRTIFYENSIAGKNKVESDLRNYLQALR